MSHPARKPVPYPPEHELARRALTRVRSAQRSVDPAITFLPDGDVQVTSANVRVVHLRQEYRGIPVHRGSVAVRFGADGAFLEVTGEPVPVPAGVVTTPSLSAPAAVLTAARHVAAELGTDAAAPPLKVSNRAPTTVVSFPHPSRPTVLRKRPFRDPVTARLTLFGAEPVLAWEVHLRLPDELGEWDVIVDARAPGEGDVLRARRTLAHAVLGLVYEFNPGEADRATSAFPCPREHHPSFGGRNLPAGHEKWASDSRTEGNNVECVRENSKKGFQGTTSGTDVRFEPVDPLGTDQELLNAFYLTNFLHDFFFFLGFDEAAGNFQHRNFSSQGEDDDRLIVRIFDKEIFGVANMRSARDGSRPEMKLGRLDGRHASFDAEILLHEYVHGVTNRIVGGRNNIDPLRGAPQPEALGEGYSDYFALSILNFLRRRAGLRENLVYGAWIANNPTTGLRRDPYGDGFPRTFASLRGTGDPAHDVAQVWCQALLRVNRALGQGDRDLGDELGWQLVMDSLKHLRVDANSPTFLHGRDALLRAFDDKAALGAIVAGDAPAVRAAVVDVFAVLGMGPAARAPSASFNDIVADFGD